MNSPSTMTSQRDLWLVRFYYFIWLGGSGLVWPFMNLFLSRKGMDGTEIGITVSIASAVALVAAPLWTRFSAQNQHPLRLLQLSLLLTGVVTIILSQQNVFLWLCIVFSLRVLVSAGVGPISDALALNISTRFNAGYGSVRVWGSLGYAVVVLGGGLVLERTGLQVGFYGYAVAVVIASYLLSRLQPESVGAQRSASGQSAGFKQVGQRLLGTPAFIGLALMLALTGLGGIGVAQFENIYLDQLGAAEGLIGIASMVSAAVEVPGMFWADHLVRKHKPVKLLIVALGLAAVLRLLVFVFPSVAMIIAARAIGGISFSLNAVALIRYICDQTPTHENSTALALFTVTLPSLINVLGTPLAGAAFDLLGAPWLYVVNIIGLVLGIAALWLAQKRQPQVKMVDNGG